MNDGALITDFCHRLFGFDQAHPLLFTQFWFWAFLALVYGGFSLIRRDKLHIRNAWLFLSSLWFYYKTSGVFLLLLLFVITYNYFAAHLMPRIRRERIRTALLVFSVAVDLLVLGYYKYAYFFADAVNSLFGLELQVKDIFTGGSIFLPVGISFFTFQAISYVVDVKKGKVEPVRNFLDFGFYLSFFPQLVAGPIVRAPEFIPQLHRPFNLSRRWFGIAVFWILNGLAKKLILSDFIAVNLCDRVFENPLLYTGFENLCALFCYSLQVYADFSGYTDIATGVAMLLGFWLPLNFNSPYKATNAGQFWKRWHISLSSWLKDYLYIPLGGNRNGTPATWICIGAITLIGVFLSGMPVVGVIVAVIALVLVIAARRSKENTRKIVTNVNSMNTMLLGGLWHGASWNFMIWGGLNGLGMIIYKFWSGWSPRTRVLISAAVTFALWLIARYFPAPVWNIFFVWMLITTLGALLQASCRLVPSALGKGQRGTLGEEPLIMQPKGCWQAKRLPSRKASAAAAGWLGNAWAVAQTFVFITFTRLFFRSGSNLDPAIANETAWNTAKNMIERIGGAWDLSLIPAMAKQHAAVLIVFALGMLVHWLPDRFKRRYRIWFSRMPVGLMALAVLLAVFIIYQFITAGLQSFIYFQF